ncbi:cysteine protease StiP family protein [Solibacillus silvestris]|uniref:cysteine protease StiP family protein n=1 Tax=Solibacillus silvestris TaxID=76853 RepID=UPI003F800E39
MKYLPDKIGSYDQEDVLFLLRDISHLSIEKSTAEREESIQSGKAHYSEMLPVEYQPDAKYMRLYEEMLEKYARKVSLCVAVAAEKIIQVREINELVLVSLARAGTPIGILIKRYLQQAYGVNVPHYTVSIIRGRGIDETALHYILHHHPNASVQFVDGWTGKGAITKELEQSVARWNECGRPPLDAQLAVLADPGHCVKLFGTREDFLIPSACLNSTVSGLVSRTVLNEQLMDKEDFHGAKFYRELEQQDVSKAYIEAIALHFSPGLMKEAKQTVENEQDEQQPTWRGLQCIQEIQQRFQIKSIHHIKPGVGETTRVLLRRVPWKILVNPSAKQNLAHIYLLAEEHNVEIEYYDNMTYACCGLIKELT